MSMTYQELAERINQAGYQTVDNAVMSARIGPPPPDMQIIGLAPPEAYDGQEIYTVSQDASPVMSALVDSMPAPATIPEMKMAFENTFNNESAEPSTTINMDLKPGSFA